MGTAGGSRSQHRTTPVKAVLRGFRAKLQDSTQKAVEAKLNEVERLQRAYKKEMGCMTTILIRKGLNGFRYSACGEKGNFLFNASQISAITRHWSVERRNGNVQFIRQLDIYPEQMGADTPPEDMTIGSRMKKARLAKGCTRRECAHFIGVAAQTYAEMENDHTYIPKQKLVCLAIRLRVNTKWLLTGNGTMKIGGGAEYEQH